MFILSICLFYIKTLIICKRRIRCGFYTLIFVETNNLVMFIFNNHKHVSRICFLYLLGKNVYHAFLDFSYYYRSLCE